MAATAIVVGSNRLLGSSVFSLCVIFMVCIPLFKVQVNNTAENLSLVCVQIKL